MARRTATHPEQLSLFSLVESQAEAAAAAALAAIAVPAPLPPAAPAPVVAPPLTLGEAQGLYHDFLLAIGRSRHTAATQRIDLRLLFTLLGDRPVATIDQHDLRNFVSWLRTERRNDPRSLRRKVASVKGFFAFLLREGAIVEDPARPLVYPAAPARLPEILEPAEAEAVATASVHHPLWLTLVLTLLDTGLKRDEALGLAITDLALTPARPAESALVVRATHEAQKVRPRRLQLTVRLHRALTAYLGERDSGAVFPLSVRAINFIVAECGRKAGIKKRGPVTPQMLRDTFAIVHLRAMISDEAGPTAPQRPDAERAALRDRHNRALLALLGLAEDGDGAQRYRILASPLPYLTTGTRPDPAETSADTPRR